jgi:hypothetical protein
MALFFHESLYSMGIWQVMWGSEWVKVIEEDRERNKCTWTRIQELSTNRSCRYITYSSRIDIFRQYYSLDIPILK